MRDNCTTLYPNEVVAQKVSEYADRRSLQLPVDLINYHAWVLESQAKSYFTISLLEARFLTWTAKMMGAQRVLEIGAFVGFSLAVWSRVVGPGGQVTGLEVSPAYAKLAREQLGKISCNNVDIKEGDARQVLASLDPDEPFDIIFIDAQKGAYPLYLKTILEKSQAGASRRLLRPGGLIIGDNVLRSALVVDQTDMNPATKTVPKQTENWTWDDIGKLDEFNERLYSDPRIDAMLVPVFDGLGMGRLVD